MKEHILVADDDHALLEMMRMSLDKEGFEVSTAGTAAAAIQMLGEQRFDLVVSDIYLGDGTGIEVLEAALREQPDSRVILVTAQGTVETVAEASAAGVFDYIAKPFKLEAFVERVNAALATPGLRTETGDPGPRSMIIGSHPAIIEVYKAVNRVARLDIPVLVTGPTGAGKELVARALHRFGANPDGPFVPINCGAIPEPLLESELFGHRKGAFTGAAGDHVGAIEAARNGTVFLDEVGDLPLHLQVKLLRFLQEGEIRPVGEARARHVAVRVVAATHRDMRRGIDDGSIREDFFYRVAGYEIGVPPLADRRSDIPLLVEHFRREVSGRLGVEVRGPGDEVVELLMSHPWPGNVRELEHIVTRSAIDHGGLCDVDAVRGLLSFGKSADRDPDECPIGGDVTLEEIERRHIAAVLQRTGGNRTSAAAILGIERKSLYRKILRLGIEVEGSG